MRFVASFAEAWIEMFWTDKKITINLVASFAEAWIEIGLVEALPQIVGCRLLRGGVD